MARKPKEPKPPKAPKVKKKRSARSRLGYWLLVLGTVLGVAAGVSYAVPIPGLTAVNAATTQKDTTTKQPAAAQAAATDTGPTDTELKAREDAVKQKEDQVSSLLKDLTQQKADLDPIAKAASMYENMPPYKAGPLMQAMDPVTAAKILKLMDEDQAGAIVSYMDQAKGAAVMTELLKTPAPKLPGN